MKSPDYNIDFASACEDLSEMRRLQAAHLDMAGETFEEIAVQASIQDREADLRLGQWRLQNLGGGASPSELFSKYTLLLFGGLLAIYFQAFIEGTDVVSESVEFRILGTISAVLVLVVVIVVLRQVKSSHRTALVRRALGRVVHDYSKLSAVSVTLKEVKQKLIAKYALLRPYHRSSWEGVEDMARVRRNLTEVSRLTAQKKLEEREFEERGGEAALQIMQECMRGRLPPFVYELHREISEPTNIAHPHRRLKKWREDARQYCESLRLLDEHFLNDETCYRRLKQAIGSIQDYDRGQLDYLISECKACLR